MFHRVSPLTENDSLAAVFALPSQKSTLPEETCIITCTRLGMIKKSLISRTARSILASLCAGARQ